MGVLHSVLSCVGSCGACAVLARSLIPDMLCNIMWVWEERAWLRFTSTDFLLLNLQRTSPKSVILPWNSTPKSRRTIRIRSPLHLPPPNYKIKQKGFLKKKKKKKKKKK